MTRRVSLLLAASVAGWNAPAQADTIVWTELRGTINPASAKHLAESLRHAEAQNARALVLVLDTPGGLISSVREMAQSIHQSSVPVYVYVGPTGASATSAGALLMLAAKKTGMAAGTNIGAAHPVGPQGESLKGDIGQKAINDTAAMARGFAEKTARNRDVAERMVRQSLSLSSEEALKAGVVDVVAADKESFLKQVLPDASSFEWKQQPWSFWMLLLHWLADPNIASILLAVGLFLIYAELSHPGVGLPGVLGGISVLIAFIAFQMLPIRVGAAALAGFGLVLILAEPFVVSHGALILGGIVSFTLGLAWIVNPGESQLLVSPWVWGSVAVAMGSIGLLTALVASRLKRQSQAALKSTGGQAVSGLAGYHGVVESVDATGLKGSARIRGELWDFMSDEVVAPGDYVTPFEVHGLKVKVRRKG